MTTCSAQCFQNEPTVVHQTMYDPSTLSPNTHLPEVPAQLLQSHGLRSEPQISQCAVCVEWYIIM